MIRGGVEPHALEVLHNAHSRGLSIVDLRLPRDIDGALAAFAEAPAADIYNVQTFMSDELVALFYGSADAVLANSGHEPFGLVGLEVMAAGGLAFVGSTGEDYAVPYLNAVVLDSDDPTEICIALQYLRDHPDVTERMRREATATATSFSWATIIEDTLLGKLQYVALRQDVHGEAVAQTAPGMPSLPGQTAAAYGGLAVGPLSVDPAFPTDVSAEKPIRPDGPTKAAPAKPHDT